MYDLGDLGDLANLGFGLVGTWMAHRFYHSSRRWWMVVIAWALFLIIIPGTLCYPMEWYLGFTHERATMLLGFDCILVYLYLFTGIPMAQRIFTYFLVDTSMNLIVLFARTTSVFFAPWVPIPSDITFLCLYLLALAAFIWIFLKWLRGAILRGLAAFQDHLLTLTIFAAVGYVTLVLLTDPWSPWAPLSIWNFLAWYGLIAFVALGYVVCFHTLEGIHRRRAAQEKALQLENQLALSEKYYQSLLEQVEQSRAYHHDMRYHMQALQGMMREKDYDGLDHYIGDLCRDLAPSMAKQYCSIGAVNALLEHHAALCHQQGFTFQCQVNIPPDIAMKPIHLCVLFGNALQNAMDALNRLPPGGEHRIVVKANQSDGRLAILVENTCPEPPSRDADGILLTTKEGPGHGFGMRNMVNVVEAYNGWLQDSWADGVFTLQIIL